MHLRPPPTTITLDAIVMGYLKTRTGGRKGKRLGMLENGREKRRMARKGGMCE
jgi:hypothetical protein